jgi:PPOX class probable F420-dependent enzyme
MDLSRALEAARTTNHSVLVTIRTNGLPQLSNVLHHTDADGIIRISTTADRAKYANLARRPWAALKVDDNFWSYAVLEGDVELSKIADAPGDATVEELILLYRDISGEHPNWDEYRAAMVADRRLVIRLKPTRAYGGTAR